MFVLNQHLKHTVNVSPPDVYDRMEKDWGSRDDRGSAVKTKIAIER